MNITVENIMTEIVVCAESDYSVQELMQIMDKENIHCIPVIDKKGHCIGVVSGADLMRWHKIRKRSNDVYAHEILSHPVITVSPEVSLQDAANLMVLNNIHHLVVLNKQELIGIVSVMDVLKHCNQEEGASKTRIIC
jgi:CBS domain-containing protein